jgi:hypothetical protein
MAFPWYSAHLPEFVKATFKAKGEAQVAERIREQARILRNMNYSQEETAARVRVFLKWEWELPRGGAIPCWDRVEQLVADTYKMAMKEREQGFPEPTKVRDEIRKVYLKKGLDPGAC